MAVVSWYPPFLFPPPPSLFLTTASLATTAFSEFRGNHLQYSKFRNSNTRKSHAHLQISGRIGMLVAYTPAFLAALSSFGIFPQTPLRFLLLRSSLTLHFFKRVFEALFLHKFSGKVVLVDAIPITLSYFISTACMIYAQHLTLGFEEPPIDLVIPEVVLFLVGISGNLYHRYLLSTLRKEGDKEYKIPKGGLFDLVVCPHYLFEIIYVFQESLSFLGHCMLGSSLLPQFSIWPEEAMPLGNGTFPSLKISRRVSRLLLACIYG